MRYFAFIFSLYILALAFVPCTDDLTCKESKSAAMADAYDHDHDHSEDTEDTCSPFCTCSCCGCIGFVISMPVIFEEQEAVQQSAALTPYHSEFLSSYTYSIWQPPKLS